MKNYVAAGNNITLPAPYALTAGQLAQVGSIIGVAQADTLITADVVLVREGVFELAKVAATAIAQGATLYWDNAARVVTTVVSTNKMIGAATIAALSADATVFVLLDGTVRV